MEKLISYEAKKRLKRMKVGERTSIAVNGKNTHISCRVTSEYMCDKCVLYDNEDREHGRVLCNYYKCCMSRYRKDKQCVVFMELTREKGI